MGRFEIDDLPSIAGSINENLTAAGFDPSTADVRQVLALNEEVGEFTGAWRRYSGQARRDGTEEEVLDEWADVVITAFVTADALGYRYETMRTAIESKLELIFTRGWHEANAPKVKLPGYIDRRPTNADDTVRTTTPKRGGIELKG